MKHPLFTYQGREDALNSIKKACGMDKLDERLNSLEPGKWYPETGNLEIKFVNLIKERIDNYDFELTFNNDFTKVKKAIRWRKEREFILKKIKL